MLSPADHRRQQPQRTSDNCHETTMKRRKWKNQESRSHCSRTERFVLVFPAVGYIATALVRPIAVGYRSWLVLSVFCRKILISFVRYMLKSESAESGK